MKYEAPPEKNDKIHYFCSFNYLVIPTSDGLEVKLNIGLFSVKYGSPSRPSFFNTVGSVGSACALKRVVGLGLEPFFWHTLFWQKVSRW